MPLTRLDNLYSSKTGKYLYVSPDDFNATDELNNRGNSPLRPFKTIQRAFIEVARYSYLPGANNDRFDQFSIMLMPGNHYIDNRPGLVSETAVENRYFDAGNLLEANRQEVIDRGVAQITVEHPDFYIPGDVQTGEWSRYKDAYRLIQQNRQHIIDRAVAEVPNQFDDFIYPDDATEGIWSRYKDAFRLITRNRDLIAQDAFDHMNAVNPPSPLPPGYNTSCVRDIGFLIDAISLDVHEGGGNQYTRKYISRYFNDAGTDWVGNRVNYTPTDASYNPATGVTTVTFAEPHEIAVDDRIFVKEGGLSFTCGMDDDQVAKSYPRVGVDPYGKRGFSITGVTANTITFNAGISGPNKYFQPSAVNYNPTTGDMVVTVGQHGLGVGRGVVLADNSFTFECDLDNRATQHTYPRPGVDPYAGQSIEITAVGSTSHTVTDAPYNAATGNVTLTVPSHGFSNGDYIKLDDGALTYTCDLDNNQEEKSYPRAGYDYPSGRWLEISNVTANTFDINVGPSEYTGAHTFVSATANGLKRQDGTFTINVGTSSDTSTHYFIGATAQAIKHEPQTTHNFASALADAIEHDKTAGLRGEETSSLTAFSKAVELMKLAITNNYTSTSSPGSEYQDLTVVPGAPNYEVGSGNDVSNTDPTACSDIQNYISTLYTIVDTIFDDPDLKANNGTFQLANVLPAETISESNSAGENKCKRDVGFFVDALALDVHLGGGNVYTRKLAQNYFNDSGAAWVDNGLQGETQQSRVAFQMAVTMMKKAITNQLYITDPTVTPGDAIYGNTNSPQSNPLSGNAGACFDVQTLIDTLGAIIEQVIQDENLTSLPDETTTTILPPGEVKCRRDTGIIVDGLIADLRSDGNSNSITNAKAYFDRFGNPLANGVLGEESESITVFNAVAVWAKKAVTNQLFSKDLTISAGPAYANADTPDIPNLASGNAATCQDVQATIDTLIKIITDTIAAGNLDGLASVKVTGVIPSFNYNRALEEWQDNSIVDLADPDNVLHKFNAETGGCIVPRGCSLIGYDLRRTVVRPLYVPDPADTSQPRTSIFNLTGGCYLWQFTIKDGDLSAQSPLYDVSAGVGKVYYKKASTDLAIPEYSHHKICIMEYADKSDLDNYYDKVGKAFQQFQTDIDDGDFEALVQENRIVGPLSDSRTIESIKIDDFTNFAGAINGTTTIAGIADTSILEVGYEITSSAIGVTIPPNTKIESITANAIVVTNPIVGNAVISFKASFGYTRARVTTKIDHGYFQGQYVAIINSGLSDEINGTWKVTKIDGSNPKVFEYEVEDRTAAALGLISGQTYLSGEVGGVSTNAVVLAEIDSVESASPYVFNCSIRSTWGQCGMWADGSKATGFKSMVVAQYTGVSLQKDDRAFIRYDRLTNTWNQASLTDAFATIPYHTKGDAYWKDDWRNFHIRASDDSFIQCVSVFAVGFFDHFLMESGGDMSITNSNSNFGNTSLHSVGFKGFAFNQDKGGYVTDIIPPQVVSASDTTINQWYTLDVQASKSRSNNNYIYLGGTGVSDPEERPAASINGYRIGAKTDEELSVTLQRYPTEPTGPNEFTSILEPSGFKSWTVGIETLTPSNANVDNYAQDAANRIEDNKALIQNEGYQYIIAKYPELLTKQSITIAKCERDIGYFVDAVVNDLRLGGNINSIQAAEAYYIAGNLEYISDELNETIDALDYVKNIMIAAMRNFDFMAVDCSCDGTSAIVNVPSTQGLVIGMKVEQYPQSSFTNGRLNENPGSPLVDAIQSGSYIRNIISDTQIELGVVGAKLNTGSVRNTIQPRTGMYLHFDWIDPAWSLINPTSDDSITQDAQVDQQGNPLPECINIATAIEGYFEQIFLVLNSGYTVLGGREADAYNAIVNNSRFIASEAVYRIATDVAYAGTKLGQNLLASTGETVQDACVDDVENVLLQIATDIKFGGNARTFDAANLYVQSKAVIGEEAESKAVFIEAGNIATEVMRQETVVVQGNHGLTQIIDPLVLPEYDANGQLVTPPCVDIANTIATSIALINSGIDGAVIGTKTLPVFAAVDRVDAPEPGAGLSARATLFTLNTGGVLGNPNPHDLESGTAVRLVPKAKAGTNPDKRLIRLPDGFNTNTKYYVIAPGRNLYPENFALTKQVLTVTEAAGTNFAAPNVTRGAAAGLYRSLIAQPKVDTDGTALASGTGLKFNITVEGDGSITLGDGGTLPGLANGGSRYELGDIVVISDAQLGNTGAPDLEIEITSVSAAEYPGVFDGAEVNKLMLATSIENAAAGIYMYSPETDSVDEDVEIELQQFTLDSKYDLHKYKSNVVGASEIETSVAHIFDVPTAGTTPQKVFVRVADDLQGSALPQLSGAGIIDDQTFFFVRYVSNKRFTLHESASDAETGDRALTFSPGTGVNFYVYANKRTSPLRFDAEYTANNSGLWYVNVKDTSSTSNTTTYNRYSILSRFHGGVELVDDYQNKTDPTLDTRYLRVNDERPKEDRVYRLRYVVPSYLDTVRDPLNGFVIKTRTDDKRRLVPQKVLLKPIGGNPNAVAQFFNPAGANELIGGNKTDLLNDTIRTIDPAVLDLLPEQQSLYDPYLNPKVIEFDSKIAATIQSARKVNQGGTDYMEVTLFDHTITNTSVKNEIFTVITVTSVQSGLFSPNATQSNDTNKITWSVTNGENSSSGTAYLQAAVQDPGTGKYSLVLKEVVGTIEYNGTDSVVTFTQESTGVTAILSDVPNSFGDPDAADKSLRTNYLYRVEGSNVYTVAPGDTITDDTGQNTYYVASIEDQGDFEDSFYIFDIDTLQERIANQQDGIYYLTCLRGNISPFPTGSGVGENFRNFKFSQPISFLYPQNYKNDPLWFQVDGTTGVRDTAILDAPAASSAADNYVHGLVTINDSKRSETKEAIVDMVSNSLLAGNTYTSANAITAQEGNATSGSEDRLIPISGDSQFPTDRKMYVELRRPSIARSGNHTFEYLGFGPGNYSTGFPLRQEVVLTDKQDFYAQAKREDGGIVFYTGLNSNGDLYIGNKKVNAITGEETFLESAELLDSEDEDEDVGNLVTTFDTPVTFNSTITVAGKSTFNAPVEINVEPLDGTPLIVQSKIPSGGDPTLFRGSWRSGGQDGDIVIGENRIRSAVFVINARPEVGGIDGQGYTMRTHHAAGVPSNITPWQLPNRFAAAQEVFFGSGNAPSPGDILFKGDFIGKSGSTSWILTNTFDSIETNISNITADGSNTLTANYVPATDNTDTKIAVGTKIRIKNFSNASLNGDWLVTEAAPAGTFFKFAIFSTITTGTTYLWSSQAAGADMLRETVNWRETGVIGAEAIRTLTDERGDYRIGINTVARTSQDAIYDANVDEFTEPRATLDVVGDSYISGTKLVTYDSAGAVTSNRYDQFNFNSDQREGLGAAAKATQGFIDVDNALVVGGDSNDLDQNAVFRVHNTDTTLPGSTYFSGGRVGINTDFGLALGRECDHNFTVIGDARISGDVLLQSDLAVNGGDITTTQSTFYLLNANVQQLDFVSAGQIIRMGNTTVGDAELSIHNASQNSTIRLGDSALTSNLQIHNTSKNATVDIATVDDGGANNAQITIGGAFLNKSSSFNVGTWQTNLDGQLQIGTQIAAGTGEVDLFTRAGTLNLFNSDENTEINFAQASNNLTMASLGGTTTIRNSLLVQASATVDSNILLRGGTSAGIIEIIRGRFSTPVTAHNTSSLDNPNIDFYKYNSTGRKIDTAGVGPWGGTDFIEGGGQITGFDNLTFTVGGRTPGLYTFVFLEGGTGTGAAVNVNVAGDGTLTIETVTNSGTGYTDNDTLTIPGNLIGGATPAQDATIQVAGVNDPGNVYFLPITTPDPSDFQIGDLLLIDRGNPASPDVVGTGANQITGLRDQAKSEIVRVVGLVNVTDPQQEFRIKVERTQEGTGDPSGGSAPVPWTDHPDECIIAKLKKAPAASFITGTDADLDDDIDQPPTGIGNGTANVRIGVAEFGGILTTQDFLRLDGNEIVGIADIVASEVQALTVTDGGDPATIQFNVNSVTGDTDIRGSIAAGQGLSKFTMDSATGNTFLAGTLTAENTLTLNGSTVFNQEFFTITNGGPATNNGTSIPLRTTFQVETSTGNTTFTGDLTINNSSGDPRLTLVNQSGDLTVYGSLSALGTGTSTFGGSITVANNITAGGDFDLSGDIVVGGDATINGGDFEVNFQGDEKFRINQNGSMNLNGITNFFSPTGARKWDYTASSAHLLTANVNTFVNASGNTILLLPETATMGDMIRIVDIGGLLDNNTTLIIRAYQNESVQGSITNTSLSLLSGVPGTFTDSEGTATTWTSSWTGGELVVQTPNAAFGLIYAGTTTSDGAGGAPGSKAGWYLMDV